MIKDLQSSVIVAFKVLKVVKFVCEVDQSACFIVNFISLNVL